MHSIMQSADNVLAAGVSGTVGIEDVRAIYDLIDKKLKAHDDIGIMLDLTGFDDATRDAIDADIKRELSLLGNLPQFKRMALVTDKEWVGYLGEWVGSIIPTMDVRTFAPGREQDALDWASEI